MRVYAYLGHEPQCASSRWHRSLFFLPQLPLSPPPKKKSPPFLPVSPLLCPNFSFSVKSFPLWLPTYSLPQPQRKDIFIIIFSLLAASPLSCLSPPPAARLIPSHGRPKQPVSRVVRKYIYIKKKQSAVSHGGSTNMPLFGRVYECKECEHWSEKKVWKMSGTKWTLPKNKERPP